MNRQTRNYYIFYIQFAMLLAIEAIFCFTPLGSIPITPVIVATTAMLPVIITSILLGTGAGALMGFFAGLFSFIIWTFTPPNPAIAFLFTPFYSLGAVKGNIFSVICCFVPRIMIGVSTGLFFDIFKRKSIKSKAAEGAVYAVAAALGSLANTILTVFGWYVFFIDGIAKVFNISADAVFGAAVVFTFVNNGIPEMIVSLLVGVLVCLPLRKILLKQRMIR